MSKELELKITDIEKDEVLKKLEKLKAKHVGTYQFQRVIAIPEQDPNKGEAWFRARSNGKTHVITYKEKEKGDKRLIPMDKYEVEVNNFEDAIEIVKRISKKVLYFENDRIQYQLGDLKITVDKWPHLPWSIEIEGPSEESIYNGFATLGIKGKALGNASGGAGYRFYGIDYEEVGMANFKEFEKKRSSK